MRDTSVCRYCGYDIAERGPRQNCPECGRPVWYSRRRNTLSRTEEYASSALIVGMLAFVFSPLLGLVLGPAAILVSVLALRRVPAGARTRIWKQVMAARVLGAAAGVIQAVLVVLWIV